MRIAQTGKGKQYRIAGCRRDQQLVKVAQLDICFVGLIDGWQLLQGDVASSRIDHNFFPTAVLWQ